MSTVAEESAAMSSPDCVVEEVRIRFSSLELERLRELAGREGATVEEYVRAYVLGPRAPGPVEALAEILRRRLNLSVERSSVARDVCTESEQREGSAP
jgi:hypothetical protein